MHSILTLTTLLCVPSVLGNILNPALEVGASYPAPTSPPILAARADRASVQSCLNSLASQLQPPAPSDSRISSIRGQSCTITAAASLSSPLISYVSVIKTYLNTIESKAKEIHTDCGADKASVRLPMPCGKSVELVFTSANSTSTTTVEMPNNSPTTIVLHNSAEGQSSRVAFAMVASAVVGCAMLLL